MNTVKEERVSFEKLKDLRALLSSHGLCLSVYMTLRQGNQNVLSWKECLHGLVDKKTRFGAGGDELINSVANFSDIAPEKEAKHKSIALFKSPDAFQVALLEEQLPDRAVLGRHFYIRPLLQRLLREHQFYVLAVSQKNTRLVKYEAGASEEVSLAIEIKTDYNLWMNQAKPDHTANSASTAVQGTADQDSKDEYLAHYYKQIDLGVSQALRGQKEPLILCGVEYELAMYRKISSYQNLLPEEVRGAANSLKSGEMHSRALEALDRWYDSKVDEAIADWNHRVGAGASNRLKDVVTAAHDGRVLTLLISDSQEQTGSFDEATHQVKGKEMGGAEDEDLVNDAAVQTVVHGGNVLVAPHHKMPNGSPLAAIYRY
jgi:hypothetical protein